MFFGSPCRVIDGLFCQVGRTLGENSQFGQHGLARLATFGAAHTNALHSLDAPRGNPRISKILCQCTVSGRSSRSWPTWPRWPRKVGRLGTLAVGLSSARSVGRHINRRPAMATKLLKAKFQPCLPIDSRERWLGAHSPAGGATPHVRAAKGRPASPQTPHPYRPANFPHAVRLNGRNKGRRAETFADDSLEAPILPILLHGE
jgi:hypothetical protein